MSDKEIAIRLTEIQYSFINNFNVPRVQQGEWKRKIKEDYLNNLRFFHGEIQDKSKVS